MAGEKVVLDLRAITHERLLCFMFGFDGMNDAPLLHYCRDKGIEAVVTLARRFSPALERMIAGLRRLRGEADTQERRPITKDILLQMFPHLNQRSSEGATLYAAFCLPSKRIHSERELLSILQPQATAHAQLRPYVVFSDGKHPQTALYLKQTMASPESS